MKNVTRLPKPRILKRNALRWKRKLLQEIQFARNQNGKPDNKYYDKYNQPEVKDALKRMYMDLCCYCEAPLKVVTKGNIEHRKPKRGRNAFPELTFDWENLHLACPACNLYKGDKWDNEHEILDAVNDRPINEHLSYELEHVGVYRQALTPRGKTTIVHADLNRSDLSKDVRIKILLDTLRVIKETKGLEQDPRIISKTEILKTMTSGEFGSLVQFAIDNYSNIH